jgi:anthranilate phosphoribosyltransferase
VTTTFLEAGGWPAVLGSLTGRHDLSREVAEAAMAEVLAGDASDAQIAAFMVALRMKGETVDELSGLVAAMLEVAAIVPLADPSNTLDIVGTGGDRAHTINVSTLAALVTAGAGAKVCKHGNRAASSSCGTADVLEALGVVIDLGPEAVATCVEEVGMGFCFAAKYHPAMRHAGPPRRELGVPTVFNFLGPMTNPGRVRRSLIGLADASMAGRMLEVLAANGTERALIVHGDDGLDELTTTASSTVTELRDGQVTTWRVDPTDLGFEAARPEALRGGTASENAALAHAVLDGDRGAHRDIVVLNAAAACVVAGLVPDIEAGIDVASASIDDGRAMATLEQLVTVSRRLASEP